MSSGAALTPAELAAKSAADAKAIADAKVAADKVAADAKAVADKAAGADAKKTGEVVTFDWTGAVGAGAFGLLIVVLLVIYGFVFSLGAASLSYAKYGSLLWAIVDFFFAYFYYPYYAFFLNQPATQPVLFGGKRGKSLMKRIFG